MTYRILITGSRDWTDVATIRRALVAAGRGADVHPQQTTVIHGGARGADIIADELAREFGCSVKVYEVTREDWSRYGKAAGHRRNAAMVAAGADVCLAFPLGESRGTRGCMKLAAAAGIPVVVHEPEPAASRSANEETS